jgi:hypothetical protein
MPFTTAGSNITQRVIFNSGTIDFGSSRVVDLQNAALSVEWTLNTLYVLNTIKPQDIARHSQRVTLTGKIKSFAPELNMLAWGSSAAGTPVEIDTLDGQPTMTSPVLTFFDRNGKEIQYQLSGAVFKSSRATAAMDEFAEFDFELEAKDIVQLYTT